MKGDMGGGHVSTIILSVMAKWKNGLRPTTDTGMILMALMTLRLLNRHSTRKYKDIIFGNFVLMEGLLEDAIPLMRRNKFQITQ